MRQWRPRWSVCLWWRLVRRLHYDWDTRLRRLRHCSCWWRLLLTRRVELEVREELGNLLYLVEQVGGGCPPPGVVALVTDVDGHGLAALNEGSNHHLQLVLRGVDLLLEVDVLGVV